MPGPWRGLRVRRLLPFLLLVLLPGLLSGCTGGGDLSFPTEYQAVFLDNGQVFFGRLAAAENSPYLHLRDVFYVQRVVSGEKKEARNILVKRGSEWHGPDFMRINTRHVVLIEPVAPAAAAPSASPGTQPPAAEPAPKPQKGEKKAPPARR